MSLRITSRRSSAALAALIGIVALAAYAGVAQGSGHGDGKGHGKGKGKRFSVGLSVAVSVAALGVLSGGAILLFAVVWRTGMSLTRRATR